MLTCKSFCSMAWMMASCPFTVTQTPPALVVILQIQVNIDSVNKHGSLLPNPTQPSSSMTALIEAVAVMTCI